MKYKNWKKKIKDWIYNKWFKEDYGIAIQPITGIEKRDVKAYCSEIILPREEILKQELPEDVFVEMMKEKLAKKFLSSYQKQNGILQ